MSLISALLEHGVGPLLELTLHRCTPLAILSALTFGNTTVLFALGANIIGGARSKAAPDVAHSVVALWAMASLSTLMWTGCVVVLHDAGLL